MRLWHHSAKLSMAYLLGITSSLSFQLSSRRVFVAAAAAAAASNASSFIVNTDGKLSQSLDRKASAIQGNASERQRAQTTTTSIYNSNKKMMTDPDYPGTALERLNSVHARIQQLVTENAFQNLDWEDIRRKILWAGGLRDLPNARPGQVSQSITGNIIHKHAPILLRNHTIGIGILFCEY